MSIMSTTFHGSPWRGAVTLVVLAALGVWCTFTRRTVIGALAWTALAAGSVTVVTIAQTPASDAFELVYLGVLYWSVGTVAVGAVLAGGVQVCARVLEVALHKAHTLHFPLEHIVDGVGTAPLSPPIPDFVAAMGRTNDAIIYGGRVQLFVRGTNEAAEKLAHDLPSRGSPAYGKPFAEIFSAVNGDFYKIDPMLFSPAAVTVTNIDTGRSFHGGGLAPEIVDKSFK